MSVGFPPGDENIVGIDTCLSAVAAAAYGLAEGVCDAFVVVGGTFLINCGAVTIGRIATGPL